MRAMGGVVAAFPCGSWKPTTPITVIRVSLVQASDPSDLSRLAGIFLDYMATVSAVSAVGWVVSPIIRRMVSLVQSYMSSQYNWKSGILSDLKNLEATLMDILLVVGAAERQHVVDINQMLLLQQMKDAVSDAEDVLDEFDYMLLKEKVEPKGLLRRIGSSSLSVGMRLVNIDKFSSNLRKVLKSLERLTITDCSDLLWLPDMTGFYSLRVLSIDRCPRLRSLPRSGLPVSLETFFLSRCHQALEEQFQRKEGPDWNKFAALPGCKWEAGRR
ncbi:hypothetical protein ZWY2020_002047 [Hordeum vulgare]|nr:hypothetical protein ZWY2020_002047 [Hordeum vulgare]